MKRIDLQLHKILFCLMLLAGISAQAQVDIYGFATNVNDEKLSGMVKFSSKAPATTMQRVKQLEEWATAGAWGGDAYYAMLSYATYPKGLYVIDIETNSFLGCVEIKAFKAKNKYVSKDENGYKEFDPFKTPYLGTSAKEYYEKNACTNSLLDYLTCLVIIVGIIVIIISFLMSKFALLFGTLGICLLYLAVWVLVNESKTKKYLKSHPYSSLTPEEREDWRQKYLTSLAICIGDEELGALIKEYAVLRGYDRS